MPATRPIEEFMNDARFFKDGVELLQCILEGIAQALPSDPAQRSFAVVVDDQKFLDVQQKARLLNENASLLDGGSSFCDPPGPCDSPTPSITAYVDALKDLGEEIGNTIAMVLNQIAQADPNFKAQIFPERELVWQVALSEVPGTQPSTNDEDDQDDQP